MKHKVLTAACILLSSCSSVQSQNATDTNSMPDWFRDALSREANTNSSARLVIPELNVSDEVLGNFELEQQDDGFWYYVSEVEDSSPIECYLYTDFDGAANTLYSVIDYELEYVGETYEQEVTDRKNFGLDVGIVGRTPYITLDTLFNVESDGEKVAGLVKAIVSQTEKSLQVCIHNAVGFEDTFHLRAKSLISAVAKGENSDVFFEPVYKLAMNGVPVGFARESYSFDEEGDVFLERVQSLVVPVGESSLSRTDTSAIEWSFADGALINANTYSVVNGEVESNFSLLVDDNDDWVVEGQLQGKEIKETLAHDDWILSSYGSYLSTQSLLESDRSSLEFNMWIEDADPGAVTPVTFKKLDENTTANVGITMGPITVDYFADEDGIIQHGLSSQANISVALDIMSVHGTPSQQ